MAKKNIHDKITRSLEARLEDSPNIYYSIINKYTPYRYKGIQAGEIDLYAIKEGNPCGASTYMLFFEIKSNHSVKKRHTAIAQLHRIKKRFASKKVRNWYFYVAGDKSDKGYRIERIKV